MATRLFFRSSSSIQRAFRRTTVIGQHFCMSSTGSGQDEVILQKVGTKGVITLNRPKALNALNLNMIRRITPQLKEWEDDSSTSMVLIKGTGGKAFCAGGDIIAVTEAGKVGDSLSRDFFREEYILNNAIGTLNVPWVALIDGITMGGGVGLSVHGTFRVASEKTLFAMPETGIGLFPDVGGGYFLPQLSGRLGVYLALTGYRLKGRDVRKAGVATHYVDSDKMVALEEELMSLDSATEQTIRTVLQSYEDQSPTGSDTEFSLASRTADIDRLFSGSTMEEIFSALENDGSDWAIKQLTTLQKMSPTSMKVTLQQLEFGRHLSLQDVLTMEYRLSQRCMEDKDFYEGVRALLVDKDNSPRWDPATIHGVTQKKVDWYFSPLPSERELKL